METDAEDAIELANQTILATESGGAHAVIELLESHGYEVEPSEFQTDGSPKSDSVKGYLVTLES